LKTCHYPNLFSFAPEARRKLAGGGTAGMPVVIALRPCRGATGRRSVTGGSTAGEFPPPFQGEKQESVISKDLGNDKL
jgi:hypothetical protein